MKSQASLLSALLLALLFTHAASAGSATWNLNPLTGDWNTAANWTPATVPNSSADTATFGVSNVIGISLSANTEVNSIVFNPGASAFTITVSPNIVPTALTITGAGIVNNSGITQNFATTVSATGQINFTNSATAGSSVVYTNSGGSSGSEPRTHFTNTSSAGSASFISEGGSDRNHIQAGAVDFIDSATAANGTFSSNGGGKGALGGVVAFFATSTAANGNFTCEGGADTRAGGGLVQFGDTTSAGDAVFTCNGTDFVGSGGGAAVFIQSATMGNATFIVNGGQVAGGALQFNSLSAATGGTARVEVFGNGQLDISQHAAPGLTIGSLEGDGTVLLGSNNLGVGTNGLRTTFAGVISGSGSLVMSGSSRLTLLGANTYLGGTIMNLGGIVANNNTGSATGPGPVLVNKDTLGGRGIIAGPVTIGDGLTGNAYLETSVVSSHATLTIQSSLTFKKDGAYVYKVNTSSVVADQVVANGVTIGTGAQFRFNTTANKQLPIGTAFTAINNTSAAPINGTFTNLADGTILNAGRNNFQASYEGGDGNDLTLTVVP